MDENNLETIESVVIYYFTMSCELFRQSNIRQSKRWWVRHIFTKREKQGDANNLFKEMILNDRESFYNYTRMTFDQFENLLCRVGPRITKYSFRKPLSAKDRLLITLR